LQIVFRFRYEKSAFQRRFCKK